MQLGGAQGTTEGLLQEMGQEGFPSSGKQGSSGMWGSHPSPFLPKTSLERLKRRDLLGRAGAGFNPSGCSPAHRGGSGFSTVPALQQAPWV